MASRVLCCVWGGCRARVCLLFYSLLWSVCVSVGSSFLCVVFLAACLSLLLFPSSPPSCFSFSLLRFCRCDSVSRVLSLCYDIFVAMTLVLFLSFAPPYPPSFVSATCFHCYMFLLAVSFSVIGLLPVLVFFFLFLVFSSFSSPLSLHLSILLISLLLLPFCLSSGKP